jgi:hypothetical protein
MHPNHPRPTPPPGTLAGTISRRSLIDWLGKAAVLAIGADLAAACAALGRAAHDGGADSGSDAGIDGGAAAPADAGRDAAADGACAADDFPFSPGPEESAVYAGWGERTVDPQELVQILAAWQLRIDGLVAAPVTLSFADVLALERQDQVSDFHCVEGWSIHAVPWNGARLSRVLDLAGVAPSATHVTIHSLGDIYAESLPLDAAREPTTLLAYGIDCATLPLRHGFPLRVVVPRKWGYKNPKYVTRLELADHAVMGFWEQRGYPYDGDVPAAP